jgi:pilus assembly protein CpaC
MWNLCRYSAVPLAACFLIPSSFAQKPTGDRALTVMVGKALIIDTEADILRVALAGATLAETVAINPREILVNGLLPGETTLVMWEAGGTRLVYDLTVRPSSAKLDAIRQQLATEVGGENVTLDFENDTAFLRGTVKDMVTATRAATIAGTLGKVVNLLYVDVPPVEAQVLLKVRFLNVERTASRQLSVNLMSAAGQLAGTATSAGQFSLGDVINLLLFRRDFNLSAVLTALETDNTVEILSEPNVLAIDGQQASFLAGGEFPYPTTQGGAVAGAVTIAFREFGVRIKFLPHITPRGTIRLHVAPEVSSLDFANGVAFEGVNVPGLDTRKVDTEVELESGQSFAIAGLLDQRVTELLSKVPGIGDIPILGKLFQSKTRTPTNSELLVIITPEIITPIPADSPLPDLIWPKPFLKGAPQDLPGMPRTRITVPIPDAAPERTVPIERLLKNSEFQASMSATTPQVQANPADPAVPAPTAATTTTPEPQAPAK